MDRGYCWTRMARLEKCAKPLAIMAITADDALAEFDLKLERGPGDEVVYRIRSFVHDGNTAVVFQVLSKDKKNIIAYAKTPKDNMESDMERFCKELEATGDVRAVQRDLGTSV